MVLKMLSRTTKVSNPKRNSKSYQDINSLIERILKRNSKSLNTRFLTPPVRNDGPLSHLLCNGKGHLATMFNIISHFAFSFAVLSLYDQFYFLQHLFSFSPFV